MKIRFDLADWFYLYLIAVALCIWGLIYRKKQRKRSVQKIKIGGLRFSAYVDSHSEHGLHDAQSVFFCPECFILSFQPGFCQAHSPNIKLKKGRSQLMQFYTRRQHELGKHFLSDYSSDEDL